MAFKLPNVRDLFIPDPDHIVADIDLDRADVQVVAAEADEPLLKEALRIGADIHLLNAYAIMGQEVPDLTWLVEGHAEFPRIKAEKKVQRGMAKPWCHGTNYGASARTSGRAAGITQVASERAKRNYFGMFPGIPRWHRRVEEQLIRTRSVSNRFGYKRTYFDRIEGLLPQALAWVPQSTVGLVINEGWENLAARVPEVDVLLQVHDSLVIQFHKKHYPHILPRIHECMLIEIPYPETLVIPAGIKLSHRSWGDCKEHPWN